MHRMLHAPGVTTAVIATDNQVGGDLGSMCLYKIPVGETVGKCSLSGDSIRNDLVRNLP